MATDSPVRAGVNPPPVRGTSTITWVGHATALLDLDGHRVLTDPLLTKRVAHLRRRRPEPPADTHDVDTVLLSHVHLDHLHLPSLRRLRPTAHIVTPRGSGRLLRRAGFAEVTEVVAGDRVRSGPVAVSVVPANHRPGRGPHSRVRAEPVGFVVEGGGHRVYFPGDTDLFPEMHDLVGDHGELDAALLPIWGWGSTLGPGHLDPARAGTAVDVLRPGLVLPVHYGTYAPEDGRRRLPHWFADPPVAFTERLRDLGHLDRLRVVDPGATVTLT